MDDSGDDGLSGDRDTKKVRFKGHSSIVEVDVAVDRTPVQGTSWRDKVLGRGAEVTGSVEKIEFLVGDIVKSFVNGIPTISFSERIQQILVRDMASTVVVKLLGKNIPYSMLQNRIQSLWKPVHSIQLMDVDNGYLLVRFQNHDDYVRVLTQGPWTVLGHYLTVQPWSPKFTPLQAFPSNTMVWVRLPGLPGFLYKREVLDEIGGLIGTVTKLDFQTDKGLREKFARMAVCVDLGKPLVSQIMVNGSMQRVEFESLPQVCFSCGRFGHTKEECPSISSAEVSETGKEKLKVPSPETTKMVEPTEPFGPWMLVEKRPRRNSRARQSTVDAKNGKGPLTSEIDT